MMDGEWMVQRVQKMCAEQNALTEKDREAEKRNKQIYKPFDEPFEKVFERACDEIRR